MKTYPEVLEYLYAQLPMFTRDGATAINKGLDRIIEFCKHLGDPQDKFKSIHIAGTNGKGSSSHMLAAILQKSGYKTGLYTSPHLLDFRERIRVDGAMVDKEFVVRFVHEHATIIEKLKPSFFEVTVAMAFDYFCKCDVDIAVIEVGLGGRLDSTNIISPIVSLITNIGMDHMNMLGNTLQEIAYEKAGIIKPQIPVVISEYQADIALVFQEIASERSSFLTYASDEWHIISEARDVNKLKIDLRKASTDESLNLILDLVGTYQSKNILGVLSVIDVLNSVGLKIDQATLISALGNVKELTGFMGRWQILRDDPLVICDTGHNEDGIKEVLRNLEQTVYDRLHFVFGVMRDKDLTQVLPRLPTDATYYFCSPNLPRSMEALELQSQAANHGLRGGFFESVIAAVTAAEGNAGREDLVFIGGSTFVVAEAMGKFLSK